MVTGPCPAPTAIALQQRPARERHPVTAVFPIEVDRERVLASLIGTGRLSLQETGNRKRIADELSMIVHHWAMSHAKRLRRLHVAHVRRIAT